MKKEGREWPVGAAYGTFFGLSGNSATDSGLGEASQLAWAQGAATGQGGRGRRAARV